MANNNEPGVFAKGNLVRVADTASEAVALTFDGWKRQEAVEAPAVEGPYNPDSDKVADVLRYVDRPEVSAEETERVLEVERSGQNRPTLVKELESRLDALTAPDPS